jgi:hypothetical protein
MTWSLESSNVRLSHLQKIHADLVRRRAALARLRKEVQRTKAALRAKIAYQKQWSKMQRTRPVDTKFGLWSPPMLASDGHKKAS